MNQAAESCIHLAIDYFESGYYIGYQFLNVYCAMLGWFQIYPFENKESVNVERIFEEIVIPFFEGYGIQIGRVQSDRAFLG